MTDNRSHKCGFHAIAPAVAVLVEREHLIVAGRDWMGRKLVFPSSQDQPSVQQAGRPLLVLRRSVRAEDSAQSIPISALRKRLVATAQESRS